MKVAILGTGNVGCALAADATLKGHQVTLIKTSTRESELFSTLQKTQQLTIKEKGTRQKTTIHKISTDLEDLKGNEVVIVTVETTYHKLLLKKIVPTLVSGQILVILPGYLSTAYCLSAGLPEGVAVVETQSSFIDCRVTPHGQVNVGFRNVRNPVGVWPSTQRDEVLNRLEPLKNRLVPLNSVVEAALHNPNLIVHTVGGIMSLPRIEKTGGDYCMYHEVFTPTVWNILEGLDGEKRAVLKKLGLPDLPYVDACHYRNSLDDSKNPKEVFFEYAMMPTRAKGPIKPRSRYITEDVPQGLCLLESLGSQLNVPTPTCSSLIHLASVALGIDFREKGRTVESLGAENIKALLSKN